MNRRMLGTIAGTALTLSLVMGGASATTFGNNIGGEGGAAGSTGSGNGHSVMASTSFRVVTGNNDTLTVARVCSAVGLTAPTSTYVHCWLRGRHDGKIYWDTIQGEPLNATVTAGTKKLPTQPYDMCVQGYAFYMNGDKATSGPAFCK